nr:protein lifeguard 1-like isoform X2 [Rhipicephalus microplus]
MSGSPYPQQPPHFLQPAAIPLPYEPPASPANSSAPSAPSYPLNPGFMPAPLPLPGIQNPGTMPLPSQLPGPQPQQPYIGFVPQGQFPAPPPPYPGPGQADLGKPPSAMSSPVGTMGRDTEPALEPWSGFSNKEIRRVFVRKVYAILMIQLAITFGAVALFIYEPHVKLFVQRNMGAYIGAYVAFIVLYIMLVCCESLRRSYPTNIILLFLFTLVMSYMVGAISSGRPLHVMQITPRMQEIQPCVHSRADFFPVSMIPTPCSWLPESVQLAAWLSLFSPAIQSLTSPAVLASCSLLFGPCFCLAFSQSSPTTGS